MSTRREIRLIDLSEHECSGVAKIENNCGCFWAEIYSKYGRVELSHEALMEIYEMIREELEPEFIERDPILFHSFDDDEEDEIPF